MLECFKMFTCKNHPSKCYECNSMSDIYNHYPCYTDEIPDLHDMFEPITSENVNELKPGEWIWDNKETIRKDHVNDYVRDNILEPIGFRQIDILEKSDIYPQYSDMPFTLSVFDGGSTGYRWVPFEENRFYRFKKER